MSKRTTVYEDNMGGINMYHEVDGETVWAAHYYMMECDGLTAPEMASQDFVALTLNGMDPVAEGWDYGEVDWLMTPDDELGDMIADSDLYNGKFEDMLLSPVGYAGERFMAALSGE